MNSQTVRAVLAYGMTIAVLVCLALVAMVDLTQFQAALVATIVGAILTNWKVPLAYFFDGVALEETEPTEPIAAPIQPPADAPAEIPSIPADKPTVN